VEREAEQQVQLMPPAAFLVVDETYKVGPSSAKATAGEPGGVPKMRVLTSPESLACMCLIKTLDNCLRINGRKTGECTQGLMADAWAVLAKYSEPQLKEFCQWLILERDHPAVPGRTEQLLSRFEAVFNARRAA